MGNLLFRKKFIIGLIVTLVLLTAVSINYAVGVDGPKVRELSLKEATDLALKNNPDIELADLAVQKAEAEYDGAKRDADFDIDIATESPSYMTPYQYGVLKWVNPK
ncbi:MAG: TolC family protein, partial [Firmicutes bacterium]|nr:TolC family protein [Bacillota bacterium]